jgi:hypothetical protein
MAAVSAARAERASATTATPACLAASNAATLMFTNRTPGAAKTVRDAVVKSLHRVPMPMTTSASRANALAAVVPVAPTAPTLRGWS